MTERTRAKHAKIPDNFITEEEGIAWIMKETGCSPEIALKAIETMVEDGLPVYELWPDGSLYPATSRKPQA